MNFNISDCTIATDQGQPAN